jgi:hypothetical protein
VQIEPAADFFTPFPLMRPERIACGHGFRAGKPVVIMGVAHDDEDVNVSALTPDEADLLAHRLRRAAGAVRALNDQEGT